MANHKRGTLYIGVTSNLIKRVWQHKNDISEGFTNEYGVHDLVWFEVHATMASAIAREKALKCWKRWWKLDLVERANPQWRDLYAELTAQTVNMDSGVRQNDDVPGRENGFWRTPE